MVTDTDNPFAQLAGLFADPEPDVAAEIPEGAAAVQSAPELSSGLEGAVRSIIGELTKIPPEQIGLDSRLEEDLDVTGLALWAVAAEIERVANVAFPDDEVRGWTTPRDIISAADH